MEPQQATVRSGAEMRKKLNSRTLHSLKPKAQRYEVSDTEIPGFKVRVQSSGKIVYSVLYRNKAGKRCRFTIGTHGVITADDARRIAKKYLGQVADGRDPQAEKRQVRVQRDRPTLNSFVEGQYGDWLRTNRKSGKATAARIKAAFAKSLGERYLDDLTPQRIDSLRSRRRDSGITPQTVNRDVMALKAMLNKAREWGLIAVSPLVELKPLKTAAEAKVRFLDAAENKRLRACLKARDTELRAKRKRYNQWKRERGQEPLPDIPVGQYGDYLTPAVILSLNTGLRRGELLGLTWRNVDLSESNPSLTVAASTAKGAKARHIPLNDEARAALKTWKKATNGEYVFPGQDGQPLTSIKTSWGNLLRVAKINNFRWHDMRHHFASDLVMARVDLNTVRELLGHSDIAMTLRYAHLAPEHKLEAVQKLNRGRKK